MLIRTTEIRPKLWTLLVWIVLTQYLLGESSVDVSEAREAVEALADRIMRDKRDSGAVAQGSKGLPDSGTGDTLEWLS